MKVFTLRREQKLPITVQEAWDFFSTPRNLARITPAEMDFVIVSDVPAEIYSGLKIEYKVRPMLGIQTGWVTEIQDVQAPNVFTDTQLKGPYKLWHHKHTFKAVAGGVLMTDEVRYALPLGFAGLIAHSMFVEKKLNTIFNHRYKTLEQIFNKG